MVTECKFRRRKRKKGEKHETKIAIRIAGGYGAAEHAAGGGAGSVGAIGRHHAE